MIVCMLTYVYLKAITILFFGDGVYDVYTVGPRPNRLASYCTWAVRVHSPFTFNLLSFEEESLRRRAERLCPKLVRNKRGRESDMTFC